MRNFTVSFLTFLRRWSNCFLDLVFPKECHFCRKPSGEDGYICLECLERLSLQRNPSCLVCGAESTLLEGPDFICSDCLRSPPAYERAFIVARFENAIRDLIHTFKYRKGVWLTEDLVRYLSAVYKVKIAPLKPAIDLVVPVPMQARKKRARGYNQAELLARLFAKAEGLPYCASLLKRVNTGILSQTRLRRSERLKNAQASYVYSGKVSLNEKVILLIDDVMTTGATCNACAQHLRAAGAAAVYVLALARPLRP